MDENQQGLIDKCLAETHKHVRAVGRNMHLFAMDILHRAEHHDDSKFEEPELSGFAAAQHKLAACEYGGTEYKKNLEELQPILEHHYANNRHHTEHFPNGINGMTLVDLIEMLADWRAATQRNKNGNIRKSLELNAAKYKFSPQLKEIFENTVREYFKE